jgi:hypothetical protein
MNVWDIRALTAQQENLLAEVYDLGAITASPTDADVARLLHLGFIQPTRLSKGRYEITASGRERLGVGR